MSLAIPEDAASVLESFTQDVANTPAEIAHLLEEIQAKDMQIQAFRDEINKRDAQLQKWVRTNGGHVLDPKEKDYSKTIQNYYDKCEILQAEKCGLSEKALIVLERQIKRLDTGLRGLQAREEFPSDWGGPSLLSGSGTGASTPVPGAGGPVASGPLQAVSENIGSAGGAPNIANAAQMRLAQATAGRSTSGSSTPVSTARAQRDSSTDANKRRRLNATLGTLPAASSNLRQSSLGPGTPKAGTPNPLATAGSRAGSAQPPRHVTGQKKAPPGQASRKIAPPPAAGGRQRPRPSKKKTDRRRQLARDRATPSTNASVSDDDDESTSPTPSTLVRSQADGAGDRGSRRANTADEDEDDENDDQLYCYCQKVSFGDMVGCDNDNCEYQWFHWECVGLKSEPEGEWLCPTCRKLPKSQLNINKD